MGTRVVINQPYYFPQLHWWNRAFSGDVNIFLDDVHHNTNFPVNRTPVFDGIKENYLTISLPKNEKHNLINEILISNSDWAQAHIKKIISYYKGKSNKWLNLFSGQIFKSNKLIDVVKGSIEIAECAMNIELPNVIYSSQYNLTSLKNDRLIELCKKVNADTLILGMGSKSYIESEIEKYYDNNISIEYQNWNCPVENYGIIHSLIDTGSENTLKIIQSWKKHNS